MEEITISDLNFFIKYIQANCGLGTVYRGVQNSSFELIPCIGRLKIKVKVPQTLLGIVLKLEKNSMRMFKVQSYHFHRIFNIPEIELLALAQHHGLKTRLLDWTRSALVALFFAIENEKEKGDAAVYLFNNEEKLGFIDGDMAWKVNPYLTDKNRFFIPLNSTPRVTAQQGLFLLFKDPTKPFTSASLKKMIIPQKIKSKLKYELAKLGINKSVIFPDIDGLTSSINWYAFR